MSVKNIEEIKNKLASISKITEGNTVSGSSKISLTVVYNRNGKRISISKKLAEILKLTDTAHMAFIIDENIVLLSKHLYVDDDARVVLSLKDEMDTIKGVATGKKLHTTPMLLTSLQATAVSIIPNAPLRALTELRSITQIPKILLPLLP